MEDNAYYEVQWLDQDGVGHDVTFNLDQEETMRKFIEAVGPISCMIHAYRMTRTHA